MLTKHFFKTIIFYFLYTAQKLYFVHRLLCYINEVLSVYFKINFDKISW